MRGMEHVRVDEGIPRKAKYPQKPFKPRLEGDGWTIPKDLDPDKVIAEYLVEQRTSGIALRYGLRRAALTRWLQKVRPAEWKEVQIVRALCTKEDGREEIYDSVSALQLSRGRELLKDAQFDLERLDPGNWAQKQQLEVTIHDDLAERLRRAEQRVIEGQCAVVLPQQMVDAAVLPAISVDKNTQP